MDRRLLLPAALLSLGLVVGAAVLGGAFYAARAPTGEVRVVGSATLPFVSDRVKWTLTLSRRVPPGALAEGYRLLREDVERVGAGLREAGIEAAPVRQPVTSQPWYGSEGQVTAYVLRQVVQVVSPALDEVESLALDPGRVLEGALLEASQLEYFYSGLPELKRSLLGAARADAEARAREIVLEELGRLLEARAGVFQIREPWSTEVASYGMYSTSTREKEITVTVHARYGLR